MSAKTKLAVDKFLQCDTSDLAAALAMADRAGSTLERLAEALENMLGDAGPGERDLGDVTTEEDDSGDSESESEL